jgi:hypothetical protein
MQHLKFDSDQSLREALLAFKTKKKGCLTWLELLEFNFQQDLWWHALYPPATKPPSHILTD